MELAAEAEGTGDVPIGAVLVSGDVLLEAKNEKEHRPDATAHAEMLLLQQAARALNAWRLSDATVYVTSRNRTGRSSGRAKLRQEAGRVA